MDSVITRLELAKHILYKQANPTAIQSTDASAAAASELSPVTARFKPKTISGSIFNDLGCASASSAELLSL